MAYKLELKEAAKALIFSPLLGGLLGFGTYVILTAISSLPASIITSAEVLPYSVAVGAAVFVIVLLDRLDNFLIKE